MTAAVAVARLPGSTYACPIEVREARKFARRTMSYTNAKLRNPTRHLRPAAGLVLLCALLNQSASAEVTVKTATKGYDIDVTGAVSASELLDAIAVATGVEIKGKPGDMQAVSNHLRDTSLERALRIFLPNAPFAIRYDADDVPETIVFLSSPDGGATPSGDADGFGDDGSGMDDAGAPDSETVPDAPDPGG